MEDKQEKVLVDPHNMARDAKGRFLPGQLPATAIMPGDSQRGRLLAKRRQEAGARAAREALADRAAERGLQRSPVAAVGLMAGMAYEAGLSGFVGDRVVNADGSEWTRVDRRGGVVAAALALKLADMLPEDRQRAAVAAVQVVVTAGGRLDAVEGEWTEG